MVSTYAPFSLFSIRIFPFWRRCTMYSVRCLVPNIYSFFYCEITTQQYRYYWQCLQFDLMNKLAFMCFYATSVYIFSLCVYFELCVLHCRCRLCGELWVRLNYFLWHCLRLFPFVLFFFVVARTELDAILVASSFFLFPPYNSVPFAHKQHLVVIERRLL